MRSGFDEHLDVVARSAATLLPAIEAAAAELVEAARAGRTIFAFGNGGSAAQAAHLAAELTGRYERDRAPVAATCLSADAVALTALANDAGVQALFARQLEAVARPGDAVVAISTSGTSPNVVAGLHRARALGCRTIALTGAGGAALAGDVDHLVAVPSTRVPRVQEVHALVLHLLAEAVEEAQP